MPQYGHDGRRTPHTESKQCTSKHPELGIRCQRNAGHEPNHVAETPQLYLDEVSQQMEPRVLSWWVV